MSGPEPSTVGVAGGASERDRDARGRVGRIRASDRSFDLRMSGIARTARRLPDIATLLDGDADGAARFVELSRLSP